MHKSVLPKHAQRLAALLLFSLIFFGSAFSVRAAWNGQYYSPGSTLNPECAPTDTNCDVAPIADTAHGGTGLTSYATGDLLYATSSSSLGRLSLGVDGKVLKIVGGTLAWADESTGTAFTADGNGIELSGSAFSLELDGNSLTKSASGLRLSDTYAGQTSITTLGTVTTGTWNADLIGDAYLDKTGNWSGIFDGFEGADYLDRSNHTGTQTASTISDFSTAVADLLSTGNGLVVNGTSFGLVLDGTSLSKSVDGLRISATYTGQSSITTLGTINSGIWHGTAIGDAYLTKSGDWTGTFDGQEGTYYLTRGNQTGTQTASTISDFSSTARGLISSTFTGLTYSSSNGTLTATAGYAIPTTSSQTNWDSAFSWGNHASGGYAVLAGKAGGQTLIGGTAANNTLVLQANSASGNTSTNAGIQFKVGDSGGTTAMTILNDGSVGIGGTSSGTKLNITADGGTSGVLFKIQDTSATSGYATTGIIQTYQGNFVIQAATSGKNVGLWDSTAERLTVKSGGTVGIGNTSPTHKLDIVAGSLSSAQRGLSLTATLSSTVARQAGIEAVITTSAGNTNENDGLLVRLLPGNVSSAFNIAGMFANTAAGTGTSVIGNTANYGVYGDTTTTTTGTNIGLYGQAASGNVNIGLNGNSVTAKNSATNIGVLGLGLNTGTTPIQLGGYFGLSSLAPTFASAALMADNGSTTSPIFVARDAGTEVFRVDDGGKVGIGITSPQQLLDLSSSQPALRITNTTNLGTTAWAGTEIGKLEFYNTDLSAPSVAANISVIGSGDSASGVAAGDIAFFTKNVAGSLTEKMRITDLGTVGIGTSSPGSYNLRITGTRQGSSGDLAVASFENAGTSSADVLTLKQTGEVGSSESAFVNFYTSSGLIGSIASNGSGVTTYNTSSDRRVKDNIEDTHYGLDDLMKISVREYTMRQDAKGLKQVGFIAQELQAIYPDAVSKTDDDGLSPLNGRTPWSIDYGRLTPLLVKAVQDQQGLLGEISDKDGLASEIGQARQEDPLSAYEYFSQKVTENWRALRNLAAVRVTALRGYFDEVFVRRSHQEEICVGSAGNETCLNKDDIDKLLQNHSQSVSAPPPVTVPQPVNASPEPPAEAPASSDSLSAEETSP